MTRGNALEGKIAIMGMRHDWLARLGMHGITSLNAFTQASAVTLSEALGVSTSAANRLKRVLSGQQDVSSPNLNATGIGRPFFAIPNSLD